MSSSLQHPAEPAPPDALRAEHDALAERLAVRRSVDLSRVALYEVFFGLVSVGLTVKLAFDRWGPVRPGVVRRLHSGPPLFLLVAAAVAIVLLLLSIRTFLRARRHAREEDALYARFREVRAGLRLDP
jgi:hypothetical protein